MAQKAPVDIVRQASTLSIVWGVLLIVFGMVAIGSPFLAAVLGLMIYMQWPMSSAWAIGVLVGVSMIISGVTRVMLSLAVRKVTTAVA